MTSVKIATSEVLDVTAASALASRSIAGGRMVPVVMADTSTRPDVNEAIQMHRFTSSGDCKSQWVTTVGSPDMVGLKLTFERPVRLAVVLRFNLPEFATAVDGALWARAMYLQHGLQGDVFTDDPSRARILIELPPTGFEPVWGRYFRNCMRREFRRNGASVRESKLLADKFIVDWRSRMNMTF